LPAIYPRLSPLESLPVSHAFGRRDFSLVLQLEWKSYMITIDLSGKTALVTGGSGELGRVMCRTLAAAGANVVVNYHSGKDRAESVVKELRASGVKALAVQADITKRSDIESMRDTVLAEFSSPDIVVTNAVIQVHPWSRVLEEDEADYESQFRSCVMQNVLMAKAFVPAMVDRGWGRFVGINTECTMQCRPGQSAYISGKAGMDRVLRVLAREIGDKGVTVNQVAPGWTISENRPDSEGAKAYSENTALKRRGTDQEIANAVVFLASEMASYITGVYLPVCGGNVMPAI
jgi:3-oxoacyl-[acyl-carrier protein] reductase